MLTPASIVMENEPVAVFEAESVTLTVKIVVPGVPVGLPVMTPPVERLNPAGSEEPEASDHEYPVPEPPEAVEVVWSVSSGQRIRARALPGQWKLRGRWRR